MRATRFFILIMIREIVLSRQQFHIPMDLFLYIAISIAEQKLNSEYPKTWIKCWTFQEYLKYAVLRSNIRTANRAYFSVHCKMLEILFLIFVTRREETEKVIHKIVTEKTHSANNAFPQFIHYSPAIYVYFCKITKIR